MSLAVLSLIATVKTSSQPYLGAARSLLYTSGVKTPTLYSNPEEKTTGRHLAAASILPELGLGGNKEKKKTTFKIKWLRGWRGSLVAKSTCSPRAVSAIPLVYVKLLTNACHSSSRRPDAFLQPLQPPRYRRTGIKRNQRKVVTSMGKFV